MVCPDVNVLVYAFNASAPLHKKAAHWWEDQLNSQRHVGVPWPVFQSFVRLLTGPHVVETPYTAAELFSLAEEWWARPGVSLLSPTPNTYDVFRRLMESYRLGGNVATDALIAAFALEHRARLATNDTDFLRFQELRLENPFD